MKTIPLILTAALLATPYARPEQHKPKGAPELGAAVVVLAAGGYVIYRMAKFCHNKFGAPPKTNAPPWIERELVATPIYGAAWSFEEVCVEELGESTSFAITVEAGQVRVEAAPATVTLNDFKAELATNGLVVTPGAMSASYSLNGASIKATQSPLSFDAGSRIVTVGAGGSIIRIERSFNLKDWEPLGAVNVPQRTTVRFEDTTAHTQAFYRVIR